MDECSALVQMSTPSRKLRGNCFILVSCTITSSALEPMKEIDNILFCVLKRGVLQFYDVYGSDNDVRLDASVVSTPGVSVICTIWHPKTEQIFATTSAGSTKVVPNHSIHLFYH